jgi:hypothetical protein
MKKFVAMSQLAVCVLMVPLGSAQAPYPPAPPLPRQKPNPPALPSIVGDWGAVVPDPNGGPSSYANLTIAPGAVRGTYTIHGSWLNGGDWGTAIINLGQLTQAGFSASATLHGFYPTMDVQLEFNWASKDMLVLKAWTHWVDDGGAQTANFPPMTFRRAFNL